MTVTLELEATAWIFEAGHRVRLDVAGADWPNTWSPPAPLTLAVDAGASSSCCRCSTARHRCPRRCCRRRPAWTRTHPQDTTDRRPSGASTTTMLATRPGCRRPRHELRRRAREPGRGALHRAGRGLDRRPRRARARTATVFRISLARRRRPHRGDARRPLRCRGVRRRRRARRRAARRARRDPYGRPERRLRAEPTRDDRVDGHAGGAASPEDAGRACSGRDPRHAPHCSRMPSRSAPARRRPDSEGGTGSRGASWTGSGGSPFRISGVHVLDLARDDEVSARVYGCFGSSSTSSAVPPRRCGRGTSPRCGRRSAPQSRDRE